MTIKTKLRLAALFPIIIGCFIVFIETRTVRIVDDVLTREKIAGQILSGSFDLSRLGNDYVQEDANDRIKQQWATAHDTLTSLLKKNLSWNAEQKQVVDELSKSHLRLGDLFTRLTAISASSDGVISASAKRRQERWARQIFTKTESMRTLAQQLGELCRNEIRQTQNRTFKISMTSLAGIIIGVVVILFFLGRSIINALSVLRRDTEIVGTGNLDHRVNIEAKDEIGDLSRDFEYMVLRLRTVTASHEQLNMEIKNREQAQADLVEKEAQLRNSLEGMSGGLMMADKDFILRVINDKIVNWYGFSKDLAKPGVPIRELVKFRAERGDFGPGDLEELIEKRFGSFQSGKVIRSEDRMPDGRILELLRSPTDDGGSVIVCNDITEQKKAEEELAEKEAQIRSALANMSGGIFMIDKDFNIKVVNENILDWYDLPEGVGRVGTPLRAFLSLRANRGDYGPGDPEELVERRLEGYRDRSIQRLEDHVSGGRILEVLRAPIDDGGMVVVCNDITKSKKAEGELRDNLEELEKFNNLAVGRELRMIDLKQEINDLLELAGKSPTYEIVE